MKKVTYDVLNGRARADNQASLEIWVFASLLGIYTEQVQVLPDGLDQEIHVQFHLATEHDRPGRTGQFVDLFDRDRINFVITLKKEKEQGLSSQMDASFKKKPVLTAISFALFRDPLSFLDKDKTLT